MDFSAFNLTRRDFVKAIAAVGAALGLESSGLLKLQKAFGLEDTQGGVPVVWLDGATCTGCAVSLLNSIYYTTIDDLAINTLDINFQPTLMAAAGDAAVAAAEAAYEKGGYVLIVEGSIPTGARGRYCTVWNGMTALDAVRKFARKASYIIAAGTCAAFGGMCSGAPNPTRARGLGARFAGKRVIAVPGCPTHPDWLVGTIAYILANGAAPPLDAYGRPTQFFGRRIHGDLCPLKNQSEAHVLGVGGCLKELQCKGPVTYADCHIRKWNSPGNDLYGAKFCMTCGGPCIGCTEPSFPDGMSPFYGHGEVDD